MVEWYILYVYEGKEEKAVDVLKNKLPPHLYRPFIPQKEIFFRRAGVVSIVKRYCFPGYVFIESQTTAAEFKNTAGRLIKSMKEVISLLSYDGKDDIAVTAKDMGVLRQLLGGGDCIKASSGYKVNGGMQIISGALMGMENAIQKVDRGQRQAKIEVEFMGEKQYITVALEIISKD